MIGSVEEAAGAEDGAVLPPSVREANVFIQTSWMMMDDDATTGDLSVFDTVLPAD